MKFFAFFSQKISPRRQQCGLMKVGKWFFSRHLKLIFFRDGKKLMFMYPKRNSEGGLYIPLPKEIASFEEISEKVSSANNPDIVVGGVEILSLHNCCI
jgi:hypothetical protein